MTSETLLDKLMKKYFGKWDRYEKSVKVYVGHGTLFPRAPLLEFGTRAVYTFPKRTEITTIDSDVSQNKLWVAQYNANQTMHVCTGVPTSNQRTAREFLILQHTDGETGPFVIVTCLNFDENMLVWQGMPSFYNKLIELLSETKNKQNPPFLKEPSSAPGYTWADHIIDFGHWSWEHICTVSRRETTGWIEAHAFLQGLKDTSVFATGGDKVNEMRRVLPYITVNTNREMVHKDKWLQLICLFAEEAKTFLGIPVINCRRAEETLRLCFTEVTERENAEKRVSEGTFMIRPSKKYWRFGCFELTWKTGGIAQHSLFAHHVPGDPVLTTLGVLGTPHFTFCRNVDKTQSVSQGTIETARERPKDKLLNQRFYYFVQTDAELAPDTIEAELQENLLVFNEIHELTTFCWQRGLKPLEKAGFSSYE